MIQRTSRYYTGPLAQTPNKYTGTYEVSVFREFPTQQTVSYSPYTWVDGDNLGQLSYNYLSDPGFWWEIMDINPTITDPFNIAPGTVLRMPNG